jgi:hypothetical protein
MSLLDGGAYYEPCQVFPEESYTDADGNTMLRASETPIDAVARFQVDEQSGTSARRAESRDGGYLGEQFYRVRFPRSFSHELGSQSQILWRGETWSVFGKEIRFTASRRTRHTVYRVRRR